MAPVSEISLPEVNFRDIPITRDLTYRKPESLYADGAAVDVTQGRRVVDQSTLIIKLRKMLGEAADYLEENHIEMKEPEWKHGQTLNRILLTMSYMDLTSLELFFNSLEIRERPKDSTIKLVATIIKLSIDKKKLLITHRRINHSNSGKKNTYN